MSVVSSSDDDDCAMGSKPEEQLDGLSEEAMAALAAHLSDPTAITSVEIMTTQQAQGQEDNTQYSRKDYWEGRFKEEEHKEWLAGYDELRPSLEPVLEAVRQQAGRDPKILLVGCGNSLLGPELFDAGFRDVVSTDYAASVIRAMAARCRETYPDLVWAEADMRSMPQYADGSFDVVLDKAAMDAIMANEGSPWKPNAEVIDFATQTCCEARRLLAADGVYIQISFAQPHFRKKYLDRSSTPGETHAIGEPFGWKIEVVQIDAGLGYFMYVCRT